MPTTYTREQIGLRIPRDRGALDRGYVHGVAIHWHGGGPIHGPEAVKAALRSWQADHMDNPDKRWSDIAYQEAFDVDGNIYRLRGITIRSAANGDTETNTRFGAFLLILGPGEHPTGPMIRSVRRRIAAHREYFPNSTRIVAHRDIRPEPTACPGDVIAAAIKSRLFDPDPPAPTRGAKVDEAQVQLRNAGRSAEGRRARAIEATLAALRRIPLLGRKRP